MLVLTQPYSHIYSRPSQGRRRLFPSFHRLRRSLLLLQCWDEDPCCSGNGSFPNGRSYHLFGANLFWEWYLIDISSPASTFDQSIPWWPQLGSSSSKVYVWFLLSFADFLPLFWSPADSNQVQWLALLSCLLGLDSCRLICPGLSARSLTVMLSGWSALSWPLWFSYSSNEFGLATLAFARRGDGWTCDLETLVDILLCLFEWGWASVMQHMMGFVMSSDFDVKSQMMALSDYSPSWARSVSCPWQARLLAWLEEQLSAEHPFPWGQTIFDLNQGSSYTTCPSGPWSRSLFLVSLWGFGHFPFYSEEFDSSRHLKEVEQCCPHHWAETLNSCFTSPVVHSVKIVWRVLSPEVPILGISFDLCAYVCGLWTWALDACILGRSGTCRHFALHQRLYGSASSLLNIDEILQQQ